MSAPGIVAAATATAPPPERDGREGERRTSARARAGWLDDEIWQQRFCFRHGFNVRRRCIYTTNRTTGSGYIYIIITKRKLRWHRRRLAERARLESEISVRRPSSSLRTKRTAPRGRVSEAGIVVLCKTFTHYIKTNRYLDFRIPLTHPPSAPSGHTYVSNVTQTIIK